MVAKRYDPSKADFEARYARWVAALESGDEAELLEVTMAIPTLNSRVLDEYFAVEGDELETPGRREMEQRLIVLLSEVRPARHHGFVNCAKPGRGAVTAPSASSAPSNSQRSARDAVASFKT